jgi:amino acid transporter
LGLTWVYLLTTSVQNTFDDIVAVAGLLFAIFYVLTALAMIVYYRRRVLGNARDFVILGLLPLGATAFLVWMFIRTVQAAPAAQVWSLIGVVAAGLLLMIAARFGLRSVFFSVRRESDPGTASPGDS